MRSVRMSKKRVFIVVLIAAIGLFLLSEYTSAQSNANDTATKERELELKLCEMIKNFDGVSDADVIVTLDSYEEGKGSPRVRGVSVICHGKQKDEVKIKIVMMVSTALGISSDKIFVSFS